MKPCMANVQYPPLSPFNAPLFIYSPSTYNLCTLSRYHFMVMFCVILMVPYYLGPLTLKAIGQDALIANL
jgi:hypothetical protein